MEHSKSKSKLVTTYSHREPSITVTKSHNNDYNSEYEPEYEYYDNVENGLSEDYDPLQPLQPLIPLKYTDEYTFSLSHSISISESEPKSEQNLSEALESFFNTFVDQQIEGEVTVCQFVSALSEISNDLTEKDIYALFQYVNEDESGFMDSVDFVLFCTESLDTKEGNIAQLRDVMLASIKSHPYMTNICKMESD